MCNLNIVLKTEEKEMPRMAGFMMATTSASYIRNSDGDGIYLSEKDNLIKSSNKLDLFSLKEDIAKSNVIISHQRLATSGKEEEWHQPFMDEDFVLVHNGILSNFCDGKASDTWGLFKEFTEMFRRREGERCENIVKCLKECLENEHGSYSIFLYDKKENVGYYIKNRFTSIHFAEAKGICFITTDRDNLKFMRMLGKEKEREIEIKDENIYSIHYNGELKITSEERIRNKEDEEGLKIQIPIISYETKDGAYVFDWYGQKGFYFPEEKVIVDCTGQYYKPSELGLSNKKMKKMIKRFNEHCLKHKISPDDIKAERSCEEVIKEIYETAEFNNSFTIC